MSQEEPLTQEPELDSEQPVKAGFGNILRAIAFVVLHAMLLAFFGALLATMQVLENNPGLDMQSPNYQEKIMQELFNSEINLKAALYMCLVMIPLCLLYLHLRKKKFPAVISFDKTGEESLKKTLIGTLAAQGLAMLWFALLGVLSETSTFVQELLGNYEELMGLVVSEDVSPWLIIVSTVILVPICEELVYRGVVLGELRSLVGDNWAIFISSVVFGLVHANFVQSIYAFLLGWVIAVIYLKSGNMLMGIASHILFNFLGGALPVFLGEESDAIVYLRFAQMGICVIILIYLVHLFFTNKEKLSRPWDINLKNAQEADLQQV